MLQFFYLYAKDVYEGTVVECGGGEVVIVKLSHIAVAAYFVVWVVPRRAMALIILNSGLRTLLKVVYRLLQRLQESGGVAAVHLGVVELH